MPFAATSMMDEDKLKAEEKNGAGPNISGSSSTFATGVPGQEAGQSKSSASGSGAKFANIQGYLDANKDQGDKMGQQIASTASSEAEDAQNKIQSFQSQAPKVEAYDPSAAYQNATQLSQQEKDAYAKARQGYQGPQTLDQVQGYSDAQKATAAASQKVANAGTSEGQQQLLKSIYARPTYTGGQNALDQTVMQNSTGAKQAFGDLTQKYSGLNSLFDSAAKDVGAKVNENIKTAQANQQKISKGEGDAWNNLVNPIQARVDQYNQNTPGMIDKYTNDAKAATFSDDQLGALGLGADENIYDLDLSSYLTPDRTQAGINNLATADERQKYAALQNLIGDQSRNQINSSGKAINPVTFDKAKYQADLAANKSNYESQLASQQQQAAEAQARANAVLAQFRAASRGDLQWIGGNGAVSNYDQQMAGVAAANAQAEQLRNTTGSRKIKKG